MRPSDIARLLANILPTTRRPTFLWGPPGVGKSSVVKQVAKALNWGLIDLRAVLLDPVDLRGLPVVSRGENNVALADWAAPKFLPIKGQKLPAERGIIFADELPLAPPLVQGAFLQGILDHRIGEIELDPGWVWVSAGNRQEDRAGANRMITPLLNRFVHIDLDLHPDDWLAWASATGDDGNANVAPEVRSFIAWKVSVGESMLFDFDPSRNLRAFPTPRSWDFMSQLLPSVPMDLLHQVAMGTVGEAAATQLVAYLRIYRDLPDMKDVFANPEKCKIPTDSSVCYALVGAMVEVARKADRQDKATLGAFAKIVSRLPQEFGMLAIKDGIQANRGLLTAPGVSKWLGEQAAYTLASA
jgi:hypothetical protein